PSSHASTFAFARRCVARAPCDSNGSECQCGIHPADAASALQSRKTERAAEEKPTPISHIFLAPAAPGTPTRRHALGRLPTPPPLPENLLSDCTENCPLRPLVDEDAGVSISKLISLPPLDEVPVHVHPFAARAPCDSKGSQCQCGIHTAEAASALRSRKTERAAKEKPTPISQFFLAPAAPGTPTRRHALGRLPTPPPPPENLLSDCTENCPLRPLGAPRRFRNPKIGQQLGAQPTPRFRWRFRWRFR